TWTSRMPMPCASRTTTGARRCSRCWLSRADPPPRIERLTHAPAACPLGDQMAWNIPGGSGKDGRNPRRRGGGSPLDRLLDPLRGVFGGDGDGGGAGPARWIAIAIVAWLLFNSFTLIAEQQRGVVLRFGEVARVMQPGPHLKWPRPIERVAKVDASSIKNFNDTVPVLTRDENIVTVAHPVQYLVDDPSPYLFATRNADEGLQQANLRPQRAIRLGARAPAGGAGRIPDRPDRDRAQPAQRAASGGGQARVRRRQQRAAGQGAAGERGRGLRQQDRPRGARPGRARAHRG